MGSLGPWELLLIFLAVLLIFGAKRIPEIARGLGKGIREFKDATSDIKRELDVNEPPRRIEPPRAPSTGTPAPRADSPAQRAAAPDAGAHTVKPDVEEPPRA